MFLTGIAEYSPNETLSSLKQDPFSVLATESFAAFDLAVRVRGAKRPLLIVCNCFGGWDFGEKQLDLLAAVGPHRVSAYQAIAWFPTAAQGQVTIQNGLQIPAVTFATETYSVIDGLRYAEDCLSIGEADLVLLHAVEVYTSDVLRRSLSITGSRATAIWMSLESFGSCRLDLCESLNELPNAAPTILDVCERGATAIAVAMSRAFSFGAPCMLSVTSDVVIESTPLVMKLHYR